MIGRVPVCYKCRHFDRDKDSKVFSCAAFKVIPKSIIVGGNPHTEPVSGDHGIRFEPLGKQK